MSHSDARERLRWGDTSKTATTRLKRKRAPRAAVACDTCRTRKVKCDGAFPCCYCLRQAFRCSYKERSPYMRIEKDVCDPRDSSQAQSVPRPSAESTADLQMAESWNHDEGENHQSVSPSGAGIRASATAEVVGSPGAASNQCDAQAATGPRNEEASGLGEVNEHTEGTEFYGPTGSFHFLSRLRSQANACRKYVATRTDGHDPNVPNDPPSADSTVVNLLHSSDYLAPSPYKNSCTQDAHRWASPGRGHRGQTGVSGLSGAEPQPLGRPSGVDCAIERECVRLYFQNQHCIHPILDQAAFLARCDTEIWDRASLMGQGVSPMVRSSARFAALYNIVLAIGAVNAGETSMLTWDRIRRFLDQAQISGNQGSPYLPIRAANLFFERAKSHLEDIFESASVETVQTLFLMSVFCQDALKPHACYMYNGMAIRTASAIGVPTATSSSNKERLLWWALYSHEIEMCSSAGRPSFLKAPMCYQIPLPDVSVSSHGPSLNIVRCMIGLAEVLTNISNNSSQSISAEDRSRNTRVIQLELSRWKQTLPGELDFDESSMNDKELITKQKIVLKLRFLNAKILLHRPFLITRDNLSPMAASDHLKSITEAASETILFLHSTYMYRPYFRTWWYNCTYALDASMVLLYSILSNLSALPAEEIFSLLEKSLEIFSVMRVVAVARRCAEITQDALDIAKRAQKVREEQAKLFTRESAASPPDEQTSLNQGTDCPSVDTWIGGNTTIADLYGDMSYNTLVENNLFHSLVNFEDWDI